MRFEQSFMGLSAPEGWECSPPLPKGVLPKEGLPVRGRQEIRVQLPEEGGSGLRLELDYRSEAGAMVAIECSTHEIDLSLQIAGFDHPRHMVLKNSMHLLNQSVTACESQPGEHRLMIEIKPQAIVTTYDGMEILSAVDPFFEPIGRVISLVLWGEFHLREIGVVCETLMADRPLECEVQAPEVASQREAFWLEANVDIDGYMYLCSFTPDVFDRLFQEFRRWGVRRVHWIDYGKRSEGYWDHQFGAFVNVTRTMDQVGEILPAALAGARRHNIEFYALLKPFDMGVFDWLPDRSDTNVRPGALPRIGGPLINLPHFCREHREFGFSRRPGAWGEAINSSFTRLDLVKEDDRPAEFSVDDLELMVSEDNLTYRLYDGPIERTEVVEPQPIMIQTVDGPRPSSHMKSVRVMRLDRINITRKYLLLRVAGRGGSFTNTLAGLVRVYGPMGYETRITLGIVANGHVGDPATKGVEFDHIPGTPSSTFPGFEPMMFPHRFDHASGFIAIARGKERDQIAMMSPAFPEVRHWWLSWIEYALDCGVDGVELRMGSHHSPLSWMETGFEKPVRDEVLRLTGVDVWRAEQPDLPILRRVRGKFLTQFLREAKALVTSRGKKLGLHVEAGMEMDIRQGARMEIHMDWQTWLREGLADSVTMKEVWPGTRLALEVQRLTSGRNVPLIFTPYGSDPPAKEPSEINETLAARIRIAREHGFAGYQQYVPCIRAKPDGLIRQTNPEYCKTFTSIFGSVSGSPTV